MYEFSQLSEEVRARIVAEEKENFHFDDYCFVKRLKSSLGSELFDHFDFKVYYHAVDTPKVDVRFFGHVWLKVFIHLCQGMKYGELVNYLEKKQKSLTLKFHPGGVQILEKEGFRDRLFIVDMRDEDIDETITESINNVLKEAEEFKEIAEKRMLEELKAECACQKSDQYIFESIIDRGNLYSKDGELLYYKARY